MSLLNDMLKDLDKKKTIHVAALGILPLKRGIIHKIPHKLAWFSLTLLFIFFILLRFVFIPLHAPTPEAKVLPAVKSASAIVSPSPIRSSEPELPPVHASVETSAAIDPVMLEPITDDPAAKLSYKDQLSEAMDAMQKGEDPRAIDLLSYFLTQYPDSIEARENLAAIYLSHGELSKADELLDEGLIVVPYNLRLTIMKARILVEQGDQRRALALLEPFHPDINQSPDYYGLLAAIYETLGRTNEAGNLYQSLIRVDSSNGQYWLGLGIALEHKKANHQAIEAYTRAGQSENAQAVVRSYAANRLKALQG